MILAPLPLPMGINRNKWRCSHGRSIYLTKFGIGTTVSVRLNAKYHHGGQSKSTEDTTNMNAKNNY